MPTKTSPAVPAAGVSVADVVTGAASTVGALAHAFLALCWRRLPVPRRGLEPGAGLARPIQRFQSGVAEVAWWHAALLWRTARTWTGCAPPAGHLGRGGIHLAQLLASMLPEPPVTD